jgi:outer membrane protein TolC
MKRTITVALLFFSPFFPGKQLFAQDGPASEQPAPAPRPETAPERLTLDQCIAVALENNPALQVERERIAELEHEYRIAAAALYPSVSVSGYYQRVDDDRLGTLPNMAYSEESLAQAKVKQVLFNGGRTLNNRTAARLAGEAQQRSAEGGRLDTVLAVSQAYYRVLEARDILKVSESSAEQREAFYRLSEAFFKAGRTAKLDLLRAEAQLFEAERVLAQAREAERLSRFILKKVMGAGLDREIDVAGPSEPDLREPADEEALLREALEGNPDLKKARLLKEQSEASLRSAQGGYWPEISLQGTYGYRERDEAGRESEWTAGIFLEWPIFDGGLTRAQAGKARSRVHQVTWNERAVRDQVQVDLRDALGALRTASVAVRSSRRAVASQEEAYQAAVEFYKRGKVTYLDVLAAQVELTQAKVTAVRAVADHQNAHARLDRVLGRNGRG